MTTYEAQGWPAENKRYLMASLSRVTRALERAAEQEASSGPHSPVEATEASDAPESIAAAMSPPPMLEQLTAVFGLTGFERDVLLLCAGVELISSLGARCAAAAGDPRRTSPTFSLALSAFPDAHWSALTLARPLRRYRLIELKQPESLALSPLGIDENILHYLLGVQHVDERLRAFLEPIEGPSHLPPSHQALVARITRCWAQAKPSLPVIELCGAGSAARRAIAAAACAEVGMGLCLMCAADIPLAPSERESLATLWDREAALSHAGLLVDCDDLQGAERLHALRSFVRRVRGVVMLATESAVGVRGRPTLRIEVKSPPADEQLELWRAALGSDIDAVGDLEPVVAQFRLHIDQIHAASEDVRARITQPAPASLNGSPPPAASTHALWDTLRTVTRGRLDDIAQRIEPAAAWDDLVLPATQQEILRDIVVHVRRRAMVYDVWGFGGRSSRGLGISALFSGASGTGKTMAAEVLANELRLDLYRVDLSQVVSKYIGETEKNLRRAFDAADESGAILLFDEADALFGKRTEIRDSHDRYANIEVSYLLQRMEEYRGLAVLTTNMKSALDQAFLRRIRFTVQFPFPDAAQRAEIWRRAFPPKTPVEGLDIGRLAQLNTAGGNIRNIALNAAFFAAEAREPIRMAHILRAARGEYAKLEKPLTQAEIGGWA